MMRAALFLGGVLVGGLLLATGVVMGMESSREVKEAEKSNKSVYFFDDEDESAAEASCEPDPVVMADVAAEFEANDQTAAEPA